MTFPNQPPQPRGNLSIRLWATLLNGLLASGFAYPTAAPNPYKCLDHDSSLKSFSFTIRYYILDWPKCSFEFFFKMLWINLNVTFGQPNITYKYINLYSNVEN